MPLHAFDFNGEVINARRADKHGDYYCLECRQNVRLRGGPQRQPHFFHWEPSHFCRQHQKGPVHLEIQSYFLRQLPIGDAQIELHFPSIKRIADVAWLSKRIIFEIQCSPISADEVLSRNRDYQQLGWSVIWILHDRRYNQFRLSGAEIALRSSPTFFTNMDRFGSGMIYDQFDIFAKGVRFSRLPPLPISLRGEHLFAPSNRGDIKSFPLSLLLHRSENWKLSLSGDLMSLFFKTPLSSYLQQAAEKEKKFYSSRDAISWRDYLEKCWRRGVVRPYQIFFRFILERMCR